MFFTNKYHKLKSPKVLLGFTFLFVLTASLVVFIAFQLSKQLLPSIDTTNLNNSVASFLPSNPASVPLDFDLQSAQIVTEDVRAYMLNKYFEANNSPLMGTGSIFVDACDKYNAPKDCLILPAIADAETDLCKYYNSAEYFNCWGFGGGGEYRTKFNSWNESIDLVTDRLVNQYGRIYIVDPRKMETVFCGDEPGCTGWGLRVLNVQSSINDFTKSLGFGYGLMDLRD